MGRVYAVASGKGGVGKTTTTATLGATLTAAGASVVLVDADLGMANLAPSLGVDDEGATLHDVLAGEATVTAAVRESPDCPPVVPGSRDLDAFADARPEGLAAVIETLADAYEYVLVDTGAGLSDDSLAPLRAADAAVLVSTPDRDALRNTAKTGDVCARMGTPVAGLVLTRADADDADRAAEFVDYGVIGTVPDDPAVPAALAAATPLPSHAPDSPAAAAYRGLARRLTDADVPDPTPSDDASGPSEVDADSPEVDADSSEVDADSPEVDADSSDDASVPFNADPADEGAGADADESGGEVRFDDSGEEDAERPDEDGSDGHPAARDDEAGDEADDEADDDVDEAAADDDEADDDEPDDDRGLLSRLFG